MLNSPVLMTLSLLLCICAIIFSSLVTDLTHLPDQSSSGSGSGTGATLKPSQRHELATVPLMDSRKLPIRFPYAAVLLDITLINTESHALALCAELTRNGQSSLLHSLPFMRLQPCSDKTHMQLVFDNTVEETPHVWSTATTLHTTKVFFVTQKQLQDLTIVRLNVENHNSLYTASFSYSLTSTVMGPKNPLYWFYWYSSVGVGVGECGSGESKIPYNKEVLALLSLAKQQTAVLLRHLTSIKNNLLPMWSQLFKVMSKVTKGTASCRSVDSMTEAASLRKKCLAFSVNPEIDSFLNNYFPKIEFCYSFFSGRMIVGLVFLLNIFGYYVFRTDEVATTIIKFYSLKRLVFSMFAHFDIIHLVFNMRTLLMSGSRLAELLDCNYSLFLWFYVMSGLGGGVVSLLWRRARGSCSYSAGASGALYGINLTLLLLTHAAEEEEKKKSFIFAKLIRGSSSSTSDTLQLVLSVVGMDIVRTVFGIGYNIDTVAHIGGALTGLFLTSIYLS